MTLKRALLERVEYNEMPRGLPIYRLKAAGLISSMVRPHAQSLLSILSIKCGNWFYWADRAERADRAESKESPVFMRILAYVVENQ
jgi:hypothetical protein